MEFSGIWTESRGKKKMLLSSVLLFSPWGFHGRSDGKESAYKIGDLGWIPRSRRPLEMGMAMHSSVLAWRIPWTEESGGLEPMESQRVT